MNRRPGYALAVSSAALLACSSPSTPPGVGPAGGVVTSSEGARLVVPPGALAKHTEIRLVSHANRDKLPEGSATLLLGVETAVTLEPDGVQFAVPATLTLPLPTPVTPGKEVYLYEWLAAEKTWEETPFLATASSDGTAYTAAITHFSTLGPPREHFHPQDPGQAWKYIEQLRGYYCSGARPPGTPLYDGCCLAVGSYDLAVDYESPAESVHDTDSCGSGGVEARQERVRLRTPDGYGTLTAVAHIVYDSPFGVSLSPDERVLSLDEGEQTTNISLTMNCESRDAVSGGSTFSLALSGPGTLSTTQVRLGPGGKGITQYSAAGVTEDATVTVTATQNGCVDASGGPIVRETTIALKHNEWHGTLQLSLSQPWPSNDLFSSFTDVVSLEVFFTFDPTGKITGSAAGTHSAHFAPGEGCSVQSISAPSFDATVGGTLGEAGVDLTLTAGSMPVSATLSCPMDPDPPFVVTIPSFGLLENVILSQHVRPHFPLTAGATATGSGSESFGDDVPMHFSYTFTLVGFD